MQKEKVSIFWFRRDLRLDDNTALNKQYFGLQSDYDKVTSILLVNKNLSVEFNNKMMEKFSNLSILRINSNSIEILDVTSNINLLGLFCYFNDLEVLDISKSINLKTLVASFNNLGQIDFSNSTQLTYVNIAFNNISEIDISLLINLTYLECNNNPLNYSQNSQILLDLNSHQNSNGVFKSSISGGGQLTNAAQAAKNQLQSRGWTIIGI